MLGIGWIGPMELLLIALVALLIFGKRLPSVMRSLGRSIVEFKKGIHEVEDEIESAANTSDRPSSRLPPESGEPQKKQKNS